MSRDKTPRRKFRRILEGLDDDWPMHEQAAYILRAFSGLQLFPDANHRTGLVIVALLLDDKRWKFAATPTETVPVVVRVRSDMDAMSARRTVDRLAERDASFLFLAEFMKNHVRKLTFLERCKRRWRHARHVRRMLSDLPIAEWKAMLEDPEAEEKRKRRLRRR